MYFFYFLLFHNVIYNSLLKNINYFILLIISSIFFLVFINSEFLIFYSKSNGINLSFYYDGSPFYLFLYNIFICYFCIMYSSSRRNLNNLIFYFSLLLLILFFVSFLFLTNNIFLFFLIYESILLPSAILCYVSSPNLRSRLVTYYFIFWTQLGSFVFFFGIVYLYNFGIFFSNSYFLFKSSPVISLLFFIGFGVKVPVWPFHFWLTKTHVEVNTSFSIFLSGVLVKIALLGFYKFYFIFNSVNFFIFFIVFIGILDITVKLINQVDFKKIVAYCTIFEMNMILISFLFYSYNTVYFYFIFCMLHTVLSNIFFLLSDFLYKRYGTRSILNINSTFINAPLLSVIILLSIILFNGIPYSLKFFIELSLFLKFFSFDFTIFFIFYLIQIVFGVIFTKLNYSILFQNIKLLHISDITSYEIIVLLFCFTFLLIITRWRNLVYMYLILIVF